jgi:hypothetical protein
MQFLKRKEKREEKKSAFLQTREREGRERSEGEREGYRCSLIP